MGRRTGAILVSLLLLLTLAVSASAAAVKMTVGVRFWRHKGVVLYGVGKNHQLGTAQAVLVFGQFGSLFYNTGYYSD